MKSRANNWAGTFLVISGLGMSLVTMASCGGASSPPHQLVALQVSPSGAGANQGDTVPFSATGTFAQPPTTQTHVPAQWSSSDTGTVHVDPNSGAATCVAVGGPVTITASAAGVTGTLLGAATLTCAAQGTGPVKLVPNSLAFSCQYDSAINKCFCSSPERVALTNSLSTSLTIDSIAVGGTYFSEQNNCGQSVGPGQSCMINIAWSPTKMTNIVNGGVSISDSDSTSPQGVRLAAEARQCVP